MRARTFNISQYEINPRTGEDLNFNESTIADSVLHKTIKRFAYICHDADVYTEQDEIEHVNILKKEYERLSKKDDNVISLEEYIKQNQYVFAGETKPRHWHVVLDCGNSAIEISTIARWFGVKENYIDVPHGHGAFLDCVEYLTHESTKQQEAGKHLYDDSLVRANFDYRSELQRRDENKLRYGKDLNPRNQMRYDVLYNGLTLHQCIQRDRLLYMDDIEKLKKLRCDYIQSRAPVPPLRINFYLDGPGGIGKNTASRALAMALYPGVNPEDCYFEIGGDNVSFDGYDGQPVLIWNDRRAYDFIDQYGRGETFDILDSHPTTARHHIKYGSVRLINAFNIINGIESYTAFLNGLAGEFTNRYGELVVAEDKSQAYRRIPIILCLREDDFDILLNKGVMEGTREYNQYVQYANIRGSFAKIAQRLDGEAKKIKMIDMTKLVLEATNIIQDNISTKINDPDQIPIELEGYGKPNQEFKQIKAIDLQNGEEQTDFADLPF